MKKAVLVTIGLMVGSFLLAQPGMGQRRGQGQGPGIDRMEMMKEKLNLSSNQEEQVENIHTQFLADVQPIENQLDIKQAELKAAISSEASEKEIDGFVDEINALRNQRFEKEINRILEVRSILDEDQKVIFDAMASHKGRGGTGRGKHGRY